MVTFAEFDFSPEPDQIEQIYNSGFVGARTDSPYDRAMAKSYTRSFYSYFPEARGVHKEVEVCLPIRACQSLIDLNFCGDRAESQKQGDCVGKMVRNQGMVDGCMDALFGETDWLMRNGKGVQYCCENHYGDRGHSGEGANCWRLWNNCKLNGRQGFLFRDVYGRYDLSKYTTIGGQWGRSGTPAELSQIADDNPALDNMKCESLEELMDALTLCMGGGRCGTQGYSSKRNEDGLSDITTTWNHAIAIGGFVRSQAILNKYGGPIFLYYHNWGAWNSGPTPYEIPIGSWFVRTKDVQSRIQSGECNVLGGLPGKNRKLQFERLMDRRQSAVSKEIIKWSSTTVPQSLRSS